MKIVPNNYSDWSDPSVTLFYITTNGMLLGHQYCPTAKMVWP